MNSRQKAALVAQISVRMTELAELIRHAESAAAQHRRQSDDEAAKLDITINVAVEQQVLKSAQQERVKLVRQLSWMDSEEAGMCSACGDPVPFARLSAVLSTRLCVVCAETTEE